jgi:hypothetical protein
VIFRQAICRRRIAANIYRTNLMVPTSGSTAGGQIVVTMQSRRQKNHGRRNHARFGAPALLQWAGIALVVVFLFWAMAMVFMQARQALLSRGE